MKLVLMHVYQICVEVSTEQLEQLERALKLGNFYF